MTPEPLPYLDYRSIPLRTPSLLSTPERVHYDEQMAA